MNRSLERLPESVAETVSDEFEAVNTVADGKNIESYTFGKSY